MRCESSETLPARMADGVHQKSAKDLAALEARGGALEVLYQAREQKITRAIGITCHANPSALRAALARRFTPMSAREQRRLVNSIEQGRKLALMRFFIDHEDV